MINMGIEVNTDGTYDECDCEIKFKEKYMYKLEELDNILLP